MRHLTASFIFATALALAPAVHAQTRTDSALARWVTDLEAAYNAKDAATIASFYAEDLEQQRPADAAEVIFRVIGERSWRARSSRLSSVAAA